MPLIFRKFSRSQSTTNLAPYTAILRVDNWDDFSFKSLFYLSVVDEHGVCQDIGQVKIGCVGQGHGWTEESLDDEFLELSPAYFSLGQDTDYYVNIQNKLPADIRTELLAKLRDIPANDAVLKIAENEDVFRYSLLRGVSLSVIHGQYKRIIAGGVVLTEFEFSFRLPDSETFAGIDLSFHVLPNSKPSTNIHILIGRNGIGKTTILNSMVESIIQNEHPKLQGEFYQDTRFLGKRNVPDDYFSSVVSVSFSAFDPFIPPENRTDRSKGTGYFYIGLKDVLVRDKGEVEYKIKGIKDLCGDFADSLVFCLNSNYKKQLWAEAIKKLESDSNFADMNLSRLADIDLNECHHRARQLFEKMSSGHAVVLLSITQLVQTVEEKTLLLIDEPESHLHPPLLSAFVRALSDLLIKRNGVAIIATHSPVVLQEVPMSCVWKLRRNRLVANADRPESETFAENVGVLTRDVFQLEVSKSGFHDLLKKSVDNGVSYDQIVAEYSGQIGFEGRAILRALIATRDSVQKVQQ